MDLGSAGVHIKIGLKKNFKISLLSNCVLRTCYLKPVLSTPLAKTKPAWLGSLIGLGIMVLPLEANGEFDGSDPNEVEKGAKKDNMGHLVKGL